METTYKFPADLLPGERVYFEGAWLPVVKASRTAEGIRVVYNAERGWFAMIPPSKTVRVKQRKRSAS